jgi:CBS domain-containing protein
VSVPREETLRDALEILADERMGAPLGVGGELLVGIVSYPDLLGHQRREAPPPAEVCEVRGARSASQAAGAAEERREAATGSIRR